MWPVTRIRMSQKSCHNQVVCQVIIHVGHQLVVVGEVASWEERGLTVISACLLSYVPGWPVPTACDHSQGWHSPTGSRMQQVLSSLDVLVVGHGLSGHTASSTAPPGANVSDVQVGIHVDLCQKNCQKMKENERKWKKMKEIEGKWKKMKENERKETKRKENEGKWRKTKENERTWKKMTENERKWKNMKENERKWKKMIGKWRKMKNWKKREIWKKWKNEKMKKKKKRKMKKNDEKRKKNEKMNSHAKS